MDTTENIKDKKALRAQNKNPWWFMFNEERVQNIIDVQKTIDDLPKTVHTFTKRRVGIDKDLYCKPTPVVCGTWGVPDWITSEASTKFVNPNYTHDSYVAGAVVKCTCGAVVGKTNKHFSGDWAREHNDDCRVEWQYDALGDLWRKRRVAMIEAAVYFRGMEYRTTRNGISESTLNSAAKRLEIDRTEVKKWSKRWAKVTLKELRDDWRAKDLARTFNVNVSTIRRWWSE